MLYGTTQIGGATATCKLWGCGTFFSLNLSGTHTVLYRFGGGSDGAGPVGQPIDVQGTFYGTTQGVGNGVGTVYSMSTSGAESVLHLFSGGSDGMHPRGSLVYVKGTLYGTTSEGGGGGT